MSIPQRPMGKQGFHASAQGLGCMGMSAFYEDKDHKATEDENQAVFSRALELGITLLDTADVYGPHTNEELVGRGLKGRRDKFQLCTKFANKIENGVFSIDTSPAYVKKACADSLKRLNVDCIDLYYMHRLGPDTPIEDTVKAMAELVKEGKVKYIGLSEVTASEIRRAHTVHPITAVQLEWSLWTRDVEAEVVPTCRELGISIVAYSPLGRGFLTGKYDSLDDLHEKDWRRQNPRFQEFEKNKALVDKVKQLAASKGVTPGQIALAWVHAQGEDIFPIPGTKRLKYLEENAAAFDVKLTAEDMKALDTIHAEVIGDRYPEGHAGTTFNKRA